jgi:transposase
MKILGCDLHAKQQTIAMVDTETGEFTEKTLSHEGNEVREFYTGLEGPVVVGIEATGAMQWFLERLEELGIVCRVGHPAKIRAAETRKQKHDRRDARLMLDLLMRKDGFPEIWMPSSEQRDLRTLLRDRHQWVKIRTRVQNTLQAMALNHALRLGRGLWTAAGQKALQALSLAGYTRQRQLPPWGKDHSHPTESFPQGTVPFFNGFFQLPSATQPSSARFLRGRSLIMH